MEERRVGREQEQNVKLKENNIVMGVSQFIKELYPHVPQVRINELCKMIEAIEPICGHVERDHPESFALIRGSSIKRKLLYTPYGYDTISPIYQNMSGFFLNHNNDVVEKKVIEKIRTGSM